MSASGAAPTLVTRAHPDFQGLHAPHAPRDLRNRGAGTQAIPLQVEHTKGPQDSAHVHVACAACSELRQPDTQSIDHRFIDERVEYQSQLPQEDQTQR